MQEKDVFSTSAASHRNGLHSFLRNLRERLGMTAGPAASRLPRIREVSAEDLIGSRPVLLDHVSIRRRVQGRVVMVTGAAGSIGSELCRQIARLQPRALIGFDEAETPLFYLDRDVCRSFPELAFHAELGNITRPEHLARTMGQYRPSILFHAAGYKHVPMMEKQVFAAVENNIFGTWQVAQAALKYGVEDFVLISTDKAVRPTSVMGATKCVAELMMHALQQEREDKHRAGADTRFLAVRFGNVLDSSGSVVPIFKEQIAAGGPVTVTHPEMRRYFITIPEAAQLVLQAFALSRGGETFVLDMGEPMLIVELARKLIVLSGLEPDREIEIQITGVRSGEKLCEELHLEDEQLVQTAHPRIRSFSSAAEIDGAQLRGILRELQQAVDAADAAGVVLLLRELIPDYSPDAHLAEAALMTAFDPPMKH